MGKLNRKNHASEAGSVASSSTRMKEEQYHFFRREQDIDIVEEFQALKHIGEIPADKIMDRMELTREINASAKRARRANLIYLKARRERELFRIDYAKTMKSLTARAIQKIEKWMKDNEVTKKQITKDMIEQEISSDEELSVEYTSLIECEEEIKGIQDDCKLIADEWVERKRTLQTQARLITAEREVVMKGND
jgi:hypothetical protein